MRTATVEDFKVGATLICNGNRHTILEKYANGIWRVRCDNAIIDRWRGEKKYIFECEADAYLVETKP